MEGLQPARKEQKPPNTTTLLTSSLSDVDVVSVRHAISENERTIDTLDAEIEGHMRTIRQLQYKKQQHLVEIRRCKGMITLAKRLPPEILASIFEECVQDGWTRTPLTVSHVCLNWRKAASIPTVWSHIFVNLDSRDPYNRTLLWLKNSQSAPLTIQLEVGNEMSQIDRTMELLMTEIYRWRALNIKSIWLAPVNQILQACNNKPAPQIRSLGIEVAQEFAPNDPNIEAGDQQLITLRNSLNAPQLRYLHIHRNLLPGRNIIPSSISHLSLSLPSLSAITRQSTASILRLLGELMTLQSLSIEVPSGHRQSFELDADQGAVVQLTQLKTLVLTGLNNIFGILPYLRLPLLSQLHLRSSLEYLQAEEMATWIEQFLDRSQPALSVLEIRDLGLDSEAYGRILPLLFTVQELRLHDSDILDTVLRQLSGPEWRCPNLQRLDLRWCGRLTGRALVELVRNRLPIEEGIAMSRKAITKITVINCSFVKEEDILDLAQMTVCYLKYKGQDDFCRKCLEIHPSSF